MLTPHDIHEKNFEKAFKGYDMDEVDAFLDQVIEDYDAALRENRELLARIESLNTQIETYRGMENSLMHTMINAQKAADEINDTAKQEAEEIKSRAIREAEKLTNAAKVQADAAIKRCEDQVEDYNRRLIAIKDVVDEFRNSIKEYTGDLMQIVEENLSIPAEVEELQQQRDELLQKDSAPEGQEEAKSQDAEYVAHAISNDIDEMETDEDVRIYGEEDDEEDIEPVYQVNTDDYYDDDEEDYQD